MFLKTKRNDLARPVMGTIFLVRCNMPTTVVTNIGCDRETIYKTLVCQDLSVIKLRKFCYFTGAHIPI